MQGNCSVFGSSEEISLWLALEPFLWESCPFAAVGVATASETENICFWVRQCSAQLGPSEPAETSPQWTGACGHPAALAVLGWNGLERCRLRSPHRFPNLHHMHMEMGWLFTLFPVCSSAFRLSHFAPSAVQLSGTQARLVFAQPVQQCCVVSWWYCG